MANDSELLMRVTVKVDPATVRQLEQVASATTKMQTSAQASTGGLKNMQRGIQNTSYQLQDFIVQVTGGQDAFRAFGQQAPQMLMGFGAMGAAIGVVAALVPVAVDAFKSLTKGSLTTEEAIEATTKSLNLLQESIKLPTRQDMDGVITQFKEADVATRKWVLASLELNKSLAGLNDIDLLGGIGSQLDAVLGTFGIVARAAASRAAYAKAKSESYDSNAGSTSDGFDPSSWVRDVTKEDNIEQLTGVPAGLTRELQSIRSNYSKTALGSTERLENLAEEKRVLGEVVKAATEYSKVTGVALPEAYKKQLEQEARLNDQRSKYTESFKQITELQGRIASGDLSTTSDIKKSADQAKADLEYFKKLVIDQKNAAQMLSEENLRLSSSEYSVEAALLKTTDARKKIIELERAQEEGTSRLTKAQTEQLVTEYKKQEALENRNQLQAKANAMMENNVTAQEKYNQKVKELDYLYLNTNMSIEGYEKRLAGLKEEYARQSQAISGVTTAIGNSFTDAILNAKKLTDVMAGLARTIAEVILKTQVIAPLVNGMNVGITDFFTRRSDLNATNKWVMNYEAALPNATGNVYDGGNVLPFARGGVVTNPKFFPMATGRGLMGESGPEAVMPLRRGPDGKLGVSAATSGGGTQVNVYNQNGGQVETKQRSSPDGGKVIDIYIKKAVAEGISSGQFDKAMGSTYGLRRQGAR